jgi:palmitoyltransferase
MSDSCPWIKGCVGLHNERSFVLFLVYFSIACLFAAWWGFDPAWKALTAKYSDDPVSDLD